MCTTRRIAALAFLWLIVGSAAGQQIGDPAPEIKLSETERRDETFTLERYRGRIVVLVFWRSKDSASLDVIPLLNKIHKEQRSKGVVVIALTPEERKDAEAVVKAKEIEYIVGYKSTAKKSYQVPGEPYAFLIDPQGRVFWRGHPEDNLEDRIAECRRLSPPIGSDIAALQSRYRKAQQLKEEREYGKAYTLAKGLTEITEENAELGEKARALTEELQQAAQKWLEEAKEARRSGDYETACRIVAEISVRFEGTDVAHDAEELVARLRAERKTKVLMRTARLNAQGEMALDKAAEFEATKQYIEAREAYEGVVARYPDTEAARQAQAAIDRIATDTVIQQYIRTERKVAEANRWLDLGDRFAKVEMYDLAREYYDKVISEHPTTTAATKARQRLKKLPTDAAQTNRKPAGGR